MTLPPKPPKLTKQITVKMTALSESVLLEIAKETRHPPAETIRGLLDALTIFWLQRKRFAFPIQIKDGYFLHEEVDAATVGTPAPKPIMWSVGHDMKPLNFEALEKELKIKRTPRPPQSS